MCVCVRLCVSVFVCVLNDFKNRVKFAEPPKTAPFEY